MHVRVDCKRPFHQEKERVMPGDMGWRGERK